VAVAADSRRQGVGTELIRFLQEKLSPTGHRQIASIVGDDSLEAQIFLRSCGFQATEILRDHYGAQSGDAYVMRHSCDDHRQLFVRQNRISKYLDLEV
jgi:ribosomal protein S18 acetylase RimI-like enzyme